MPGYHITWEVDVFDAASPREAAQKALDMMQRPDTTATVFDVLEHDGDGTATRVDLLEEEEDDEDDR